MCFERELVVTKREQIIALHRLGKTVRSIAVEVYGLGLNLPSRDIDRKAAYVRVVLRQRTPEGISKFDRAYRSTDNAKAYHRRWMKDWQNQRYQTDTEFREKRLAAARAYKRRLSGEIIK